MIEAVKISYITDRTTCPLPLEEAIECVLEAGFTSVQLREKDLPPSELYALAKHLKPIVKRFDAAFIINSSVEIAVAVGADGVHLSYTALPIDAARIVIGKGALVGLSAHTPDEALAAEKAGANYVSYSPVFQTPSKRGIVPTVGLEGVKAVVEQMSIPVVALGGITADNAASCYDAGAFGIAVKSRGLDNSKDFCESARAIVAALKDRV